LFHRCAMLVSTLVLCALVVFLVDFVHLNLDDSDRSKHCRCFTKNDRLQIRVARARMSVGICLADPNTWTISATAHMFGRVLGYFAGQPYLRFPLDMFYMQHIDDNMYVHSCIRNRDAMVDAGGGSVVCPGEA
jgi:hypothetical protein